MADKPKCFARAGLVSIGQAATAEKRPAPRTRPLFLVQLLEKLRMIVTDFKNERHTFDAYLPGEWGRMLATAGV